MRNDEGPPTIATLEAGGISTELRRDCVVVVVAGGGRLLEDLVKPLGERIVIRGNKGSSRGVGRGTVGISKALDDEALAARAKAEASQSVDIKPFSWSRRIASTSASVPGVCVGGCAETAGCTTGSVTSVDVGNNVDSC